MATSLPRPLLVSLLSAALLALAACGGDDDSGPSPTRSDQTMTVTSTAFADGQPIPAQYTCDGANVSPPISWSGAPEGVASFVVVMGDPDAPGADFVHWLVYDLPGDTTSLPEGVAPDDILPGGAEQGTNSFGEVGYGGPCPPPGEAPHRYVINVEALNAPLDLPAGVTLEKVLESARGHTMASGVLTGTYGR